MIKHFTSNTLFCLLLFWFMLSHASSNMKLSIEVTTPLEVANEISMDNVYRVLEAKDKHYYAGFRIDSDGSNYPLLVEFDLHSHKQKSWEFENIISDIFIYDSTISVVLVNGKNYSLVNGIWKQNINLFDRDSLIVFSDSNKQLVSCSPASLTKADSYLGGCKSYHPDWQVSFAWYDVKPEVCGNFLYAVTREYKHNQRIAIDLNSGKIVHRKKYSGENICKPF